MKFTITEWLLIQKGLVNMLDSDELTNEQRELVRDILTGYSRRNWANIITVELSDRKAGRN